MREWDRQLSGGDWCRWDEGGEEERDSGKGLGMRAAHLGQWLSNFGSLAVSWKTVAETHITGHPHPRVSHSEVCASNKVPCDAAAAGGPGIPL